VEIHPRASVFHSPAWLDALQRTYGYDCIGYTTAPPGQDLQNAFVFCLVDSWLTGRRLVSLPFSDHCDPLARNEEDLLPFFTALEKDALKNDLRYIEIRSTEPLRARTSMSRSTATYSFHELDLRHSLDEIFRNFHKDSTQRKIRRAERDGLVYQEGSTERFIQSFYRLHTLTRRRHRIPPQPQKWFRNLAACFGEGLKVRIAARDNCAVAAMLTLRYKNVLVYKYGASDPKFRNLGSMHLLFWKAIQEAKNSGLHVFDLGRTDLGQTGLINFKDRWGAKQSTLTYCRYSDSTLFPHIFDPGRADWKIRVAKQLLAHAHPTVLTMVGNLLYKHVG